MTSGPNSWHVLDVNSIWLKEFATALGELVLARNWVPSMSLFGHWNTWQHAEQVGTPPLELTHFPLQRGYARFPINWLLPFQKAMLDRLGMGLPEAEQAALIVTTPFYAPIAEAWPGRVVYYQTDLTKEYAGINRKQVIHLDQRLCRAADAVCPNSERIADYFVREAGCDRAKITVIPNATRASNVLPSPLYKPANLPADLNDLPRPIVGVVGNLAGNLDWLLIREAVRLTPAISWAFVGPTDMKILDTRHFEARRELIRLRERVGSRVRFVGPKPYGELRYYARAFDAALIPYLKNEPTYSGSATRFYEHLAACRPILASRGHAELLTKEPLLRLVSNGEELADQLAILRSQDFSDGLEELRWKTSFGETWKARAQALLAASTNRLEQQVENSRVEATRS